MKHYENDLGFQWFYQGFKNIFWFVLREDVYCEVTQNWKMTFADVMSYSKVL